MKKENKVRGKTVKRQLRDEAEEFIKSYSNTVTQRNYRKWLNEYIKYCRNNHNCKTKEECSQHIQEYAKYLEESEKYSASTIHNYLAPVCKYYGVSMKDIEKPTRHPGQYTKSRTDNNTEKLRKDRDPDNPIYAHTVEFQRRVGIRVSELKKLEGRDFRQDESGYWCVFVKSGKGGKDQFQRILPDDINFVKSYFERKGEREKIFDKSEFSNSVDYHHIRADQAKRTYYYYLERLRIEPEYASVLEAEIRARWNVACTEKLPDGSKRVKEFDEDLIKGFYKVRGENKKSAIKHGLPTVYNKLAVAAVSIFHLSHWRNDVTVQSYLLSH